MRTSTTIELRTPLERGDLISDGSSAPPPPPSSTSVSYSTVCILSTTSSSGEPPVLLIEYFSGHNNMTDDCGGSYICPFLLNSLKKYEHHRSYSTSYIPVFVLDRSLFRHNSSIIIRCWASEESYLVVAARSQLPVRTVAVVCARRRT